MLKHHNQDLISPQQNPSSNLNAMMQSPQPHNPPMGMLAANMPGPSSQMGNQRFQVIPHQAQTRLMRQPQAMLSSNSLSAGMNPPPMHGLSPGQQSSMGYPTGPQGQQQQPNVVRRVVSQPTLQGPLGGIGTGGPQMGVGPQSNMQHHLRQLPPGHHQLRIQHQQQQTGHISTPDGSAGPGNRQGGSNMLGGAAARSMHSQQPLMSSLGVPPGHAPMVPSQQNAFHGQSMSGQNQPPQSSVSPRPMSQPSHMPNGMTLPNSNVHASLTSELFTNPSNHLLAGNSQRGNALAGQYYPNSATSPEAMDVTPSMGATGPLNVGGARPSSEYGEGMLPIHDRFEGGFNTGTPANPPRPPSSSNPNPSMTPVQHHSLHPMSSSPSNMPGPISRPLSQPQPMNPIPAVASRTPRPQPQPSMHPAMARMMPNGTSSLQPGQPTSLSGRQPGPGPAGPSSMPQQSSTMSRLPINPPSTSSVGEGQGIQKVLAFSYFLAEPSNEKLSSTYWQETIERYFTQASQMKLTLWKDNEHSEAKVFEITKAIIPQFFLATMQSGVKSMSLGLDGARERLYAVGHSVVETARAVWTCRYHNGYVVTLTGPLTVRVVVCSPSNPQPGAEQPNAILKFEQFQFDAYSHEKFICVENIQMSRSPEPPKTPRSRNAPTPVPNGPPVPSASVTPQGMKDDPSKRPWDEQRTYGDKVSLPVEPVNAFGIPQATMRVLELAESVTQMQDLVQFCGETGYGPIQALKRYSMRIREQNPALAASIQLNGLGGGYPNTPLPPGVFPDAISSNSAALYPPISNPPVPSQLIPPPSSSTSPKITVSASNSPQKQHKSISQRPSSTSNAVPVTSTPTTTPTTASNSLKRKQAPTDTASPTISNAESGPPPAKRDGKGQRRRRTNATVT